MKRILGICMVLCLAASVAVVGGCNSEDTKNYDVPISWSIGGSSDCSWSIDGTQTPVDDVTVTVWENEDDEEPYDGPVTVSCSDLEYEIPRLKRGTYFVEVVGLAEYEGSELSILKESMEIIAPHQDSHDNEFVLFQAKGAIHVTWSFDNNQMCGPNGVLQWISTSIPRNWWIAMKVSTQSKKWTLSQRTTIFRSMRSTTMTTCCSRVISLTTPSWFFPERFMKPG